MWICLFGLYIKRVIYYWKPSYLCIDIDFIYHQCLIITDRGGSVSLSLLFFFSFPLYSHISAINSGMIVDFVSRNTYRFKYIQLFDLWKDTRNRHRM